MAHKRTEALIPNALSCRRGFFFRNSPQRNKRKIIPAIIPIESIQVLKRLLLISAVVRRNTERIIAEIIPVMTPQSSAVFRPGPPPLSADTKISAVSTEAVKEFCNTWIK
jgi:hypothetical protein